MTRRWGRLVALAIAVAVFGAACSSEPGSEGKAGASDARPSKVPILEGYTYYIGGPVLKQDAYGRERIAKFLGEVAQPPGRGLVIGAKRDGDKLEYRVWINGNPVGTYRGVVRDGLFWREYAETYRGGKPVAREFSVNDDAAKMMRVKVEDVDPVTGETIRTQQLDKPYAAPDIAFSEDEDDEADEPTAAAGTGAQAAPPPAASEKALAIPAPAPGQEAGETPPEGK